MYNFIWIIHLRVNYRNQACIVYTCVHKISAFDHLWSLSSGKLASSVPLGLNTVQWKGRKWVQGNCILGDFFKYKPHLTSHSALSTLFTKRRWGYPKIPHFVSSENKHCFWNGNCLYWEPLAHSKCQPTSLVSTYSVLFCVFTLKSNYIYDSHG